MGRACSTNGEKGNAYRIFAGHPRQKYNSENIGLHGRIILKWIK